MSNRGTPWGMIAAAGAVGAAVVAGYMAYSSAAEAEAKAHAERVAANKAASAKRDAERAAAEKAQKSDEAPGQGSDDKSQSNNENSTSANAASASTTTTASPSSSSPTTTTTTTTTTSSSSSSPGVPCEGCDCGLEPEEGLAGSVGKFDLHLFVHTGVEGTSWAPRLEEENGALGTLLRALGDAAKTQGVAAKITCIDTPSAKSDSFDVTVWPHGLTYHAASPANARNLMTVLADPKASVARVVQLLMRPAPVEEKPYVYVCIHAARDERCGTKGAAVKAVFEEKLGDSAVVAGTSHVGGHKYAGNVIVYPDSTWYGYVCPTTAGKMSESIVKGEKLDFPSHMRGKAKWVAEEN